jgi:RimJ/RimL family protein N-acetyltransferase
LDLKAPEKIESDRLILQRPRTTDLEAIFTCYASDPEVTRFVGWPRHRSFGDTQAFLAFSESEWDRWPAGAYIVRLRADGTLLGSTGLGFETPYRASTGYVFARNAWGKGYATETLQLMVQIAKTVGVRRLYALCHTEHRASWRVLEKGGFLREGTLHQYIEFPNLKPGELADVFCYAAIL